MPNLPLLAWSLQELEKATPAYIQAGKFYDGTFTEPFQSLLMQRLLILAQPDYKAVLSAVPVDAIVDKLEIVDVQASTPEATEALQDKIWDANNLQFEHKTAILAAEKFGDAYLFIWPEEDDSLRPLAGPRPERRRFGINPGDEVTQGIQFAQGARATSGVHQGSPNSGNPAVMRDTGAPVIELEDDEEEDADIILSVTFQSPMKTRVFYDESNPRRKTHAVKVIETGKGKQRRAWLYYADGRIEKYETSETKNEIKDFKFVEDIENDLGMLPFVHLRNGFPYGTPRHKRAYGPQNSITKLIVNQMSGSDFDAFPQRWALAKTRGTSGGDDIDWDMDDTTLPDQEAGTVSNLTSGPGRIWDLSGFDSVGQFSTGDVDQFLKPMEKYIELMASTTGTPMHFFTNQQTGGGAMSGEAIRQRDSRLNQKAKYDQGVLDTGFREALMMGLGHLGFEDESVSIKWEPVEFISEEERLELVKKKVDLGIPLAVALAEAGWDEETVEAWTTGQPTDGELERRVGILATMGDALQKIGTAATLGVEMSTVNEIVDSLLGKIQGLNDDDEPEDREE